MSGFYNMPNVKAMLDRNLASAKSPTFVKEMIKEIHFKNPQVVRIHVAGDFFDAAYARRWVQIVKACPQVKFYAYTRSWSDPKILAVLAKLAVLKNMRLWFSCDQAMSHPPRVRKTKIAYMSTSDDDMPTKRVDLIFRTDRRKPLKFGPRRTIVCPVEQGVKREAKITCEKCGICFLADRLRKVQSAAKQKLAVAVN